MSEEPGFIDAEPGGERAGERASGPASEAGAELRQLEERLAASERERRLEAEELLTRMGAVEVLIDDLNRRFADAGAAATEGPAELDLRLGGVERALDELGPLYGVPATIAALEQEVIALGQRLDLASHEAAARSQLVSREIEARVSMAEANLSIRHDEEWEGMQDVLSRAEAGARGSERRVEERLAEQAAAASAALEDLEGRVTASLEALSGRLGTATSASGSMAESLVARLELIERDIAEIEARFERLAPARATRPSKGGSAGAEPSRRAEAEPVRRGTHERREGARGPASPPPAGAPDPVVPPRQPEPASPVNLNEASFEVLRSLGCSVTQTARILAARKIRGGFSSPDDLEDVPGLPAEFRAQLIRRLTV